MMCDGPTEARRIDRITTDNNNNKTGHSAALRRHLMLLLVDFLSVSPQLPPELKACLQPAAFALIDALTPFEVRAWAWKLRQGI